MATKAITVRVIVESVDDEGEVPKKLFDERYTLSGYTNVTPGLRQRVSAAASDVEFAHTTPAMIMVASHDNPVTIKLAAGETEIEDCMLLLAVANQSTTAMGQLVATTEVLVSGNGNDAADIEHWTVTKA